ncbi:MAG: GDP-mannose 4,6-dehydratase [Solirubrobacteraceae bacterium]|nr:GDP-mannose 4,6-dehydratase [Solirubrobacteraceae bacterium]
MRILVTGASGFLGRHVVDAAVAGGHAVVAASRSGVIADPEPGVGQRAEAVLALDLADPDRLAAMVRDAAPDAVIHLAGFANVGWSHRAPAEAIATNTAGTAALLTAVVEQAPGARVVLASTSEVYARSPEPLGEADPTGPESPYGLSKLWMEQTADYVQDRHGLSIGIVRSFAHCGPGQGAAFAVSNFARQIAEARLAGQADCVVRTGSKATVRDYSDARDAAQAYLAMAACDHPGPLNAGAGEGRTTAYVVAALAAAAGIAVDHVEDPDLVRPGENPAIVADIAAIAAAVGWQPSIRFAQSAADAVAWWTQRLERDPSLGTGIYG